MGAEPRFRGSGGTTGGLPPTDARGLSPSGIGREAASLSQVPPRSVLYVPASRPRMLARIPSIEADAFIVDLEDAVAPSEKEAARRAVLEQSRAGGFGGSGSWAIRVNAAGTPWHEEDLDLVERTRAPAVVLPKAEWPEEVRRLASRLADPETHVDLTIETARGVASARELAACHPRIRRLVLGSADLRRSLRARPDPDREWERHALGEVLLAARAAGVAAIDSVYFHFRDSEGLRRHAKIARSLGYDGKSAIHPDQLGPIHEVFASDAQEIAWAKEVVAAWEREARGGVVVVDGEMIEALHVELAQCILDRATGSATEPS